MEILQEMSTRRLRNLRRESMTNLLLGADNNEAIKSIDSELERRGIKEVNCDDCYWIITDKTCHMQPPKKKAECMKKGKCNRFRKCDNKGGWIRDKKGNILNP